MAARTMYAGAGNETVLTMSNDRVMVELADIGEGMFGDYDSDNQEDVALLRFYVYEKQDGEWLDVEESSRCTGIPVDLDADALIGYARVIFDEFNDALPQNETGVSIKAIADRLSWLGIE